MPSYEANGRSTNGGRHRLVDRLVFFILIYGRHVVIFNDMGLYIVKLHAHGKVPRLIVRSRLFVHTCAMAVRLDDDIRQRRSGLQHDQPLMQTTGSEERAFVHARAHRYGPFRGKLSHLIWRKLGRRKCWHKFGFLECLIIVIVLPHRRSRRRCEHHGR